MHPDLFGNGDRETKRREAIERKTTGAPLGHIPKIGRPERETVINQNDFDFLHETLEIEGNIDVARFLERIEA